MATISTKPWSSFSQADYSDDQWYAACLINLNTGPRSSWSKGKAKLPVREPSGALNANAISAAAGVLAGARGGVDAPPAAKKAAARQLVAMYSQLRQDPPQSLRNLAA